MESESRTVHSIKNSFMAMIEQLSSIILSFVCRSVFIYSLNKVYLGFNGLFSDILTLLSLGELGFGTAIIFSMYKPAAEKNYQKLSALLNLYKKIYNILGIVLTVVGLLLTPFLNFFISGVPHLKELPVIYILYLLNTTGSYFFIYKKSILIVDQKNSIASIISTVFNALMNITQIITLLLYHNFIVYLIIQLVCTLGTNLSISIYVDKHYKFIKKYSKSKVDKKTKSEIFKNVKAMFVSKVSSAVVTSTDNLLISKFVSTIILGYYSNYTLFVTMIRTIMTKIFESVTGSVGNLVVSESTDKIYKSFCNIWFINFWLVGFCCDFLFVLINPFITLWIGKQYLLNLLVVFMICINLYMRLIRNTFLAFTDTFGLFIQLKWKSIFEAIINLVVSLIFVGPCKMGIVGVLLGTLISNLTTNFWYEPYLIFVKKFQKSWLIYLKKYMGYLFCLFIAGTLSWIICSCLGSGIISFALKGVISFIVINGTYLVFYFKTNEFSYMKSIVFKLVKKIF